jgi:hypothetical protein
MDINVCVATVLRRRVPVIGKLDIGFQYIIFTP